MLFRERVCVILSSFELFEHLLIRYLFNQTGNQPRTTAPPANRRSGPSNADLDLFPLLKFDFTLLSSRHNNSNGSL